MLGSRVPPSGRMLKNRLSVAENTTERALRRRRLGMIETVLGPLTALAAMLVAVSIGVRATRRPPVPVPVRVRSGARRPRRTS